MSNLRYYILLLIASVVVPANAYELGTHGRLTFEAYNRSVVKADSSLLGELGVQGISNPFGTTYYDMAGDEVRSRAKHDFEQSAGRMPEEVDPLSIVGWLLRGAIREDDLGFLFSVFRFQYGDDPHDDPYGSFWRVTQHFYDPVNDRPLTLSLPCLKAFVDATQDDGNFKAAPSWGLGVQDAFSEPNTPDVRRRNHFSVLDAREAMYRALTGRNNQNEVKASTAGERDKYWATTFRALGDVVHLIQDVAQPQHTRNDPHGGAFCFGGKSGYEKYIEARATGDSSHNIDKSITTFPPLAYEGYALPRFTRYSDFFSTAPRDSVESGLGLADYSNRGFFSAGTNLGENDYPLPPNDRNHYIEQTVSVDGDARTSYLLDTVFDRLNPALREFDVPKTKESLWYDPLVEFAGPGIAETFGYTLDQRIYDAQANLLIPRAVAYSAGLIDYFFRGRLEAVDPMFTDEGVSLKVKNAIDVEKVPEWANESLYAQKDQGHFVLTVTYKQGTQEALIASDPVNLTTQAFIKPGETTDEVLGFTLPPLPANAADVQYRLVFRGRLGQEDDAIAVGIVEPVSGFIVRPNYVPSDGIAGNRLIVKSGGQWRLTEDRNLQAGNIDWKGAYENGRATRVLTWWGPSARYFPDPWPQFPFRADVYQNGERFAVAPYPVLGAAINRDTEGREWLVAICTDGVNDIVYKRPNAKSTSPALFEPVTQPDGWRELGRFDWQSQGFSTLNIPWFFNGNGTEAQTMRVKSGWRRLKFAVSESSAMASDEGNLEGITGSSLETRVCAQETYGDHSGCKGNCAGVVTQGVLSNVDHYDLKLTSSGQMIVAVDYKNNNPVFATYSREVHETARIHRDGRQDFRYVCSRDILGYTSICDDPSNYSFTESTREAERTFDDVAKITVPGMPALTFSRHQGTRRLTMIASSESLGGKGVGSRDDRIPFSDFQEIQAQLIYVDLRHGAYVSYEKTIAEAATGDVFLGAVGGDLIMRTERTVQTGQQVHLGAKEVFLNKNAAFIEPASIAMLGPRLAPRLACGETKEQVFDAQLSPHWLQTLKSDGSWAVDSQEHLFVSMPVLGDNPSQSTGEFFNYLMDGDLLTAIPGAPANPRYYPAGVVK